MFGNVSRPLIITAIAVLCYYNSINCGFVFDDISAIRDNKDLRPHASLRNIFLNDFWGTPIKKEQSHKSYRPLTILTFRLNYWLHELQPEGYHFVNVSLHIIVCLLYYRVCKVILPQTCSFLAALLFSLHPIHTEAVTGVVGRAEILSSVFYLAAFLTYLKSIRVKKTVWLNLIYYTAYVLCAMLSKEQGITIAGICAAYDVLIVHKIRVRNIIKDILKGKNAFASLTSSESFKRLLFLIVVTLMLLFGRLYVMGSQLPTFTRFDNPASAAHSPWRQLTFNYLVSVNAWLLLFPCHLCCDWTMGTIPIIESLADARILAIITTYTILGLMIYKAVITSCYNHSNIILMGLAFTIFPFLPASNLFFPVGFVVAERVLYMPSMGYCMIIAYGYDTIRKRWKTQLMNIFLLTLLTTHGLKTYTRNWDWVNEYILFMSGLKVNQQNAKLFNNVGHALENDGEYERALKYFQKAVEVQRDDVGAYINVGRTYNHLKMYQEAEDAYLLAKSLLPTAKPGETYQARIAPNHLNVFINLANLISRNRTRLEEADRLYRQAISMRSDYIQAYINRGDILMKLNKTKQAQEVYERALLYDSENPDIYYNLGVVFLEQGKTSEALAYLEKALELNPDHDQALLNSAILLQELGRTENRNVARIRLLKLIKKEEDNERIPFNLGMLSMDENNTAEAELWFKRAIIIKEDFRSALFNLALLLADANRPLEAVPFLNQLVKYHPDHTKGFILLGDIYINNMKDLDMAENCYRRILELEPHNIQGTHNLCVVFVERGKLAKALSCLKYAHELAPKEDYILRHFEIVKNRLKKLQSTPDNNPEKILAYSDYDPNEFKREHVNFNNAKSDDVAEVKAEL